MERFHVKKHFISAFNFKALERAFGRPRNSFKWFLTKSWLRKFEWGARELYWCLIPIKLGRRNFVRIQGAENHKRHTTVECQKRCKFFSRNLVWLFSIAFNDWWSVYKRLKYRCSVWLTFLEFRVFIWIQFILPQAELRFTLRLVVWRLSSHLNNKRICTIVLDNWPSPSS